jgi:hypothetical protein
MRSLRSFRFVVSLVPKASALRFGIALVWVVLAAAYVVRSAFVAAYFDTDLERAERLWPDHPSVQSARVMMQVAAAASNGEELDREARSLLGDIARAEPLAPEPFVIAGAEAQRNGDTRKAETLLLTALQRDPRSRAAHFLLAEHYISEGRIREGVPEAAILGRLVPGSLEPLSQAFALHIETAGIPEGMGDIMQSNPDLSERILNQLAAKSANADLLLKIAAMEPRLSGPAPPWQTRLVNELVEDGDYVRARQVWAGLSGRKSDFSETVHDPRFAGSNAPPPFNWTFATQGAVIEPQAGRLRILYFGRDDVALASQLLVLRPGRYRLRVGTSGQIAEPESMRWQISCLPGKTMILDRPIASGGLDLAFVVPPRGCGAQQFQLTARAGESAASSDFLISNLSLTAAGAR